MKKSSVFKMFFGSFMASIMLTLIVMLISFLVMVFSSGDDGYRSTLFNTLFFESVTDATGTMNVSFGLTENYIPLIAIAGYIFLFIFSTCFIYSKLKAYKEKLLNERDTK